MAGHSKWKNIMHKKGKTDAQRGKIFTKIGREMTVAIKEGGPDPQNNTKLRDLIAKAKANNVPNDNIDRAIKKAAGDSDKNDYETIIYEGYGAGGVAFIVEALTDNRNRTAGEVRHYFDKFGGNLGTSGCVSYMFEKKGVIILENNGLSEDEVMEAAMEIDASDFEISEDVVEIQTEPADFSTAREYFESKGYKIVSAEIEQIPNNYTKISDEEQIKKINILLEFLEDNDDIQNVYNNLEVVQ